MGKKGWQVVATSSHEWSFSEISEIAFSVGRFAQSGKSRI
jgi:hypothetical protein